jgi:hypothetical protein
MSKFLRSQRHFLSLVTLLAALGAAYAQSVTWQNLGPWGGAIKFLRYSDSGDTLFVLTGAGLHRSAGTNGKWETLTGSSNVTSGSEFAIHGDTIVVLGNQLVVSKDLGKTWKFIPMPSPYSHIAFRGGTLYLSRDTLVFRSENLGDSIEQAACANLAINTVSRKTTVGGLELTHDTLVVSGGDVFYSTDKGEAFATMGTPENPTAIAAMSVFKGDVQVIGYFGKAWTKRIGGASWSLGKTYSQSSYGAFKCIAYGSRKIMLTNIGAYDFTSNPETALNLNGLAALSLYQGGMLVLDSSKVLASAYSTSASVYSTVNGGAEWKRIDIPGFGVTAFAKTDTALYAAGSSKYVFRGTPDGQTWTKVDSSLSYPAALGAAPTGLFCWANGLYRSTDGGATWAKGDTGFPVTSFRRFIGGAPGFFALSDSGIHKLSDDGASWSYARPYVKNEAAMAGYISGDTLQVALRAGDSVRVVQTADKGATWKQVVAIKSGSGNNGISVTAFFGSTVMVGQDTVMGVFHDGEATLVNGGPWKYEMSVETGKLYVRGKDGIYTVGYDAFTTSVPERVWTRAVKGQSVRFVAGGRIAADFALKTRQAVGLELYSLSGRLLGAKSLGVFAAGSHHVEAANPVAESRPMFAVLKAGDRIVAGSR